MIGYPLDSHVTFKTDGTPVFDRAISSAPYRKLIKSLFSDGVLPNPSTNLQISAGTGMQVNLYAGFAICNGCQKLQESNTTLDIETASAVNDRIDTIVLRLNDNDDVRECEFYVLTGTPAVSPARPALTQNDSIWEIGLADVLVKANSTQISNANITDTRYETARCGVISSISEFDTTTLYQQIQSDLSEFRTVTQAEVLAWFENIKSQISGDVAVNLQNQIGSLNNLTTTSKSSLVDAINEVNEKEVDVLDSKEEIEANTTAGKVAGALAVKEMVSDLSASLTNENAESFNFGVKDGVRGFFTNPSRADDSFVPFKSGGAIQCFTADKVSYSISGDYQLTYDISAVYDDYQNLTIDNMCGGFSSVGSSTTSSLIRSSSATFKQIDSYDSSTGIITYTITIYSQNSNRTVTFTPCFYVSA